MEIYSISINLTEVVRGPTWEPTAFVLLKGHVTHR